MMTRNRRLIGIMITASFILLIPMIAMQFTNEVNWTVGDFLVGGAILLSVGLGIEFILRKVKRTNYRLILLMGVLLLLILTWIEMAVGIFGTPIAGS